MASSPGGIAAKVDTHFTVQMQDRQARDKDPFNSSSSSSGGNSSSDENDEPGNRPKFVKESYEILQRRRDAAVILSTPELLLMYSQSRCDSLAGTRHHFTKMLCGYLGDREEATNVSHRNQLPQASSRTR